MRFFPRQGSGRFTAFHGVLVVGVLVVALVLGVSRMIRGDAVPTSEVPAVGWGQQGEGIAVGEPTPGTNPDDNETDDEVTSPVVDDVVPVPVDDKKEEVVPSSHNLALPFTSQAPTGNWDVVHEDTCEEASVHMIVEYFNGTPSGKLNTASADKAMLALVAYEDANGYGYSVSAAELQAIILDFYDGAYDVDIIEDPSADDLKALIADGFPVIIPAAGRMLGNPFFTGEGPLYHMLVLRGYEDGRFVTNDPGTRHGENYTYDEDVFMNAIHDWNNGDPVHGARRVLVMKPAK